MLGLVLGPPARRHLEVLCIGAHCDDIEIGCGGTLLAIQRLHRRCRIHWLILTSVPARKNEAVAAARLLVRRSALGRLQIHELPDGFLPAHFAEVKAHLEEMKRAVTADLVFTHHRLDRHQDHSLVSDATWQTFRDHMIWEYEIPKYDGDLRTPNMYVPLSRSTAQRKIAVVLHSFPSQLAKPWFRAENLEAVLRLRGIECRAASGYAEGFHCHKLVASTTGHAVPASRVRTRAGH